MITHVISAISLSRLYIAARSNSWDLDNGVVPATRMNVGGMEQELIKAVAQCSHRTGKWLAVHVIPATAVMLPERSSHLHTQRSRLPYRLRRTVYTRHGSFPLVKITRQPATLYVIAPFGNNGLVWWCCSCSVCVVVWEEGRETALPVPPPFAIDIRYPLLLLLFVEVLFFYSLTLSHLHYRLSHSISLFSRLSLLFSRQRYRFSFSRRPNRDDKGQQNGGFRVFVIVVIVLLNGEQRSNSICRITVITQQSPVEPADTVVRRRYDCCRRVIGVINLLWPRVQGCRPPADYDDALDESSYWTSTRPRNSTLRIVILISKIVIGFTRQNWRIRYCQDVLVTSTMMDDHRQSWMKTCWLYGTKMTDIHSRTLIVLKRTRCVRGAVNLNQRASIGEDGEDPPNRTLKMVSVYFSRIILNAFMC